jgi:hypothetical protein
MTFGFAAIVLVESFVVAASLFALASGARKWLGLEPWRAYIAGLAALGIIGALQFWATFVSVGLTFPIQLGFGACVLALLAIAARRRDGDDLELLTPCALVFAGSLIVIGMAFYGAKPEDIHDPLHAMMQRWRTWPLASDNEIPWLFAQQLRQAQILKPFAADWLSSDRPPLQTGLYLLLNGGAQARSWYQACGTALQMTALGSVWALSRAVGIDRIPSVVVASAALATPFMLTNGAYVWPKLLASAYVCGVFAMHFHGDKQRPVLTGLLTGAAAALAMLAHGTSAFAFLGIGVVSLMLRRFGSWRYVLAAGACALALYAPWTIYQKAYDPPGDRLLAYHLAGVYSLDERPAMQAIADAYRTLTPGAWAQARLDNVAAIVGARSHASPARPASPIFLQRVRDEADTSTVLGMGLLGIALLAAPALVWPRSTRALAAVSLATLIVWVMMIFLPGETIVKHGSFFPQLALIVALGCLLSRTPRRSMFGLALLAAQVLGMGILYAN